MKNIFKHISAVLLFLFCYACTNDDNIPASENAVYLEGDSGKNTLSANIEDSEISVPISVRAAKPVDNQVQTSIRTDESAVEEYNKSNGTQYTPLPAEYYTLQDSKYTIEKGKYISNTGILKIKSLTGLPIDKKYIIPVSITSTTNIPLLQASKTLYVIANRTITTRATSLTGNAFKVDFFKNNQGLNAMKTITYEARVFVNNFQKADPRISTIMGVEENFLLRFGDIDQLQVAGGNSHIATGPFSTGVWYHFAAVYDGSQLKLYSNGELLLTKNVVRTIDLTSTWAGGFYIGYSAGGRYLDGAISEARIWSRALSRNELINGVCGVNPKSEGLIAYWKFDKSDNGRVIKDLTGNGRDAVATSNIKWVEGVKCSN
ncbi:hypothetical protein CMU40_00695 [Elizabethkingia anophelis]|uniref:DUF1735 and LamG domain-containing protein n=1 Tax=Elizabethkingia anophelis TaxID=1117645 RepID=UPI0021A61954|nr:DUF1735 domain-containing protein [Elizabethkingia anophelis]MCT3827690.1 DUF1735 domain-containing protein [Elizabethkingia anophelis]MCT3838533.1 DUF1735 domain-containing protein [Elizabethkingia anophelis]MCT3842201.1 DUF1735 domain-containing protein [Elizabethkingia anophelis]MCT3849363.1 DUF1735 domain-containing protein [Elizabethkingia anophelis]